MPSACCRAPLNARFIHRQTLASAVRFTTTELADLEAKIAGAADRALAIELAVFDELTAAVVAEQAALQAIADGLAVLDVAAGLAVLAEAEEYCRPTVDRSLAFHIEGGRHPVVEQALRSGGEGPFVANDCDLGARDADEAGAHLAGHRAQHGRQVHLPAPERADRRARPDRRLRAGPRRPYRRRRPPVLAASAPPTISPAAAPPSWSR